MKLISKEMIETKMAIRRKPTRKALTRKTLTKKMTTLLFFCCFLSGCSSDPVVDSEKQDLTRTEESKAIEKLDRAAQEEAVEPPKVPVLPSEEKKAKPHWSYDGSFGPEYWGGIDSSFLLCSQGEGQSPVDLKWKQPLPAESLQFIYSSGGFEIIDNGHTIEVRFAAGSNFSVNGQVYELKQLHFHSGSEHFLSGAQFPLEMHLVHMNDSKEIAVVGVFFKPGAVNENLNLIWSNIPDEKKRLVKVNEEFNPALLLPKTISHYRYTGSLTTPPCTEGVKWHVLNTPLSLSKEQLQKFNDFYSGNFRPLQQLHDREVINH